MKYFHIALFIFYSLFSFSQERISTITFSQTTIQYLRTYNGNQYLIKVSNKNEVTVYDFKSSEEIIFLHSTSLDGISNSMSLTFVGPSLSFSTGFFQTVYNFVTNVESSLPVYNNHPQFVGWGLISDNGAIYKTSLIGGGNETNLFFKGTNVDILVLPGELTFTSINDNYLIGKNNKNSLSNEYYLYNAKTKESKILVEDKDKIHEFTFSGDKCYFVDVDHALVEYNLKTYQSKEFGIYGQVKGFKTAGLIKEGKAYIYNTKSDSITIEVFDVATKQKIKHITFYAKKGLKANLWEVLEGKIVFRTGSNKMIVLDVNDNGKLYEYPLPDKYEFTKWPIFKERYLMIPYKKTIKVVDLKNMEEETSNIEVESENIKNISYFEDKSGIGSFMFFNQDKYKLNAFKINNDKTIYTYPFFTNEVLGLSSKMVVRSVNDKIYACDSVFYSITGANVERINVQAATNMPLINFTVIGNKIYYYKAKTNGLEIYYIEDGKEFFVTNLGLNYGKTIYDIKETSKGLYFNVDNNKIVLYDFNTQLTKTIVNNIEGFFFYTIAQYEDDLFVKSNDILIKIDKNGDVTPTNVEMALFAQAIFYRENLYFVSDGKIYQYQNGEVNLIFESDDINAWLDPAASHLFFNAFSYSDFNYHTYTVDDNGNVDERQPLNYDEPIYVKTSNVFFNVLSEAGGRRHFIFDNQKNDYVNLEGDFYLRKWVGINIMNNDTIAMIYENDGVSTYVVKNYFKQLELIDHLAISGTNNIGMKFYDDLMIAFNGNELFLLNSKGKFTKLNSNRASINTSSVERQDGYIYYLGVDNVYGRQLFRYKIEDVNATPEVIGNAEQLLVYPNPTNGFLSISNISIECMPIDYTIYNLMGAPVKSGQYHNENIDVSTLASGQYILSIKQKNQVNQISRFTKL